MVIVGGLCCCSMEFSYYSYCRKPTEWEFLFEPKRFLLPPELFHTQIVVKLLTIELNPANTPSLNPFGRGYLCSIGRIHRNGTTMVVMYVGLLCLVFLP